MTFISVSAMFFFSLNSQDLPLNALMGRTFGCDLTSWEARKGGKYMLSWVKVICVTRSAACSLLPELLKHCWPHAVSCVRARAELKAAKGVRSNNLLL